VSGPSWEVLTDGAEFDELRSGDLSPEELLEMIEELLETGEITVDEAIERLNR